MVVNSTDDAQIALLLVSHSLAQIHELRRDLQASKYLYQLVECADKLPSRREFADLVGKLARRIPVVIVVNFEFPGLVCETLLSDAYEAAGAAAIACVVTHAPDDADLRAELRRRGARLFDDVDGMLSAGLVLQ